MCFRIIYIFVIILSADNTVQLDSVFVQRIHYSLQYEIRKKNNLILRKRVPIDMIANAKFTEHCYGSANKYGSISM